MNGSTSWRCRLLGHIFGSSRSVTVKLAVGSTQPPTITQTALCTRCGVQIPR